MADVLSLSRAQRPRDALIRLNRLATATEARNAVLNERITRARHGSPAWIACLRELAKNDQTLARLSEQRIEIVERTVARV